MTFSYAALGRAVMDRFVGLGLVQREEPSEVSPQRLAAAVLAVLDALMERNQTLSDLLQAAAGPGGIGEHEFSRPGGWRERARQALATEGEPLRLFYIAADDDNGENVDLLVRASTPDDAQSAWRAYFSDSGLPEQPKWIGVVPVARPRGAIPWDDIQPGAGRQQEADGAR